LTCQISPFRYRNLDILSEEKWPKRLTDADPRALSPLFWTHVNRVW
jgi:hypothetical protein